MIVRTDTCKETKGALSFAPCNLKTGVCGDLDASYQVPQGQGTQDPRVIYDKYTQVMMLMLVVLLVVLLVVVLLVPLPLLPLLPSLTSSCRPGTTSHTAPTRLSPRRTSAAPCPRATRTARAL